MAAKDAGQLVGILFLARDMAHRAHLKTSSYAQHVALNGFYDNVLDAADKFAEAYQGQFGVKLSIPYIDASVFGGDIVTVLQQQSTLIESMRASVTDGNQPLSNIVDEIINVYQASLYMLSLN